MVIFFRHFRLGYFGRLETMRCKSIAVMLGLFFFAQPAAAEKRVALVVGNATYQSVSRLANPKNDAELVADTLRKLGFSLIGGGAQVDLDKAKFDSAIQNFGNQLIGADVALFYYAGHGLQVRGTNYLVPVTANPTRETDVDFQMVDVAIVLRQMEGAGTKLNLVLLDACRNNPFGGRGLRSSDGGLAQMRAPEGTLLSYATQPGNVALDGNDGHSPYTRALVETVQKPAAFEAALLRALHHPPDYARALYWYFGQQCLDIHADSFDARLLAIFAEADFDAARLGLI